jgi:demethoxyubiquinone hydroxylase (CLK1/Coq7/Cat5 family)
MENILAFVLGAGAGLIIWGVVVAFKTAKQVRELVKQVTDMQIAINTNEELINRRVDQEINRVNELYNDSIKHADSRVDRLEFKIATKDKQVIQG